MLHFSSPDVSDAGVLEKKDGEAEWNTREFISLVFTDASAGLDRIPDMKFIVSFMMAVSTLVGILYTSIWFAVGVYWSAAAGAWTTATWMVALALLRLTDKAMLALHVFCFGGIVNILLIHASFGGGHESAAILTAAYVAPFLLVLFDPCIRRAVYGVVLIFGCSLVLTILRQTLGHDALTPQRAALSPGWYAMFVWMNVNVIEASMFAMLLLAVVQIIKGKRVLRERERRIEELNRLLLQQRHKLQLEQRLTHKLLFNIFPDNIALAIIELFEVCAQGAEGPAMYGELTQMLQAMFRKTKAYPEVAQVELPAAPSPKQSVSALSFRSLQPGTSTSSVNIASLRAERARSQSLRIMSSNSGSSGNLTAPFTGVTSADSPPVTFHPSASASSQALTTTSVSFATSASDLGRPLASVPFLAGSGSAGGVRISPTLSPAARPGFPRTMALQDVALPSTSLERENLRSMRVQSQLPRDSCSPFLMSEAVEAESVSSDDPDGCKALTGKVARLVDADLCPKMHQCATILFADLVGFTSLASGTHPHTLVSLLDSLFGRMDDLCLDHGVEKIKTVGDCYMCVGWQEEAMTPAEVALRVVTVAREMHRLAHGIVFRGKRLTLRAGVHMGTVVSGIIGKAKFAFDIWGDAVNVASRMESTGFPGVTQISGDVYEALEDKRPFTKRGLVEIKGKGRLCTYVTQPTFRPLTWEAEEDTSFRQVSNAVESLVSSVIEAQVG